MASGSFSMATSNPYISGLIEWSSSSNGSSANSSRVTISVNLKRNNSGYTSYGTMNTYVTCNGAQQSETGLGVTITEHSWLLVYAKVFTVPHNSNGTKVCGVDISGNSDFGCSFSKHVDLTLDTIPRYTSITSFGLASRTGSSLIFNWATADTISKITCKFNGVEKYSSSVNSNSGSFPIDGLLENTTYSNITITVTRKDSGLTTTSSAMSETTTWLPHTSNLALSYRGINSIAINWSSNYVCDAIWIYNGGTQIYSASGLNTTNGTVTLSPSNWSSIEPGTTYSLKINVRRKESQWGQMSGVISVTTLSLPIVNSSTPNTFNIGDNLTVNVSNADNAAYSIILQTYQSSWTTYKTVNVAQGTTSTSLLLTASALYDMCPNSNSLPVRVTCQTTVNSKTYASTYYNITANVTNSNPTFSDFIWETNVGTNINDIISGTTNMITGYGGLRLKFATNSANALNSSSISDLEAKIIFNGSVITTGTIPYSASAFNFDVSTTNITTAGTYTIQINSIDSRGNKSSAVSKSFTVYPYSRPSVSASVYRFNNFEQATLIKLTGKLAKLTISGVQKNSVASLQYRYAESGTAYPSTYTNITGYTTSNISGTDDLLLTFNKADQANPFTTLDYAKSYTFQFVLTDNVLSSTVFEVFVSQGVPLMSVSDDGYVGVGMIPDFDSAAKLQVDSDIMAKDSKGNNLLLVNTVSKIIDTFLDKTYPVGSIYMSINSTNPSSLFGGTWVSWGSGRVPVGVNTGDSDFNSTGKTGGEKNHTLTSSEVPSHNHTLSHTHSIPANTAASNGAHVHNVNLSICRTDTEAGGYGLNAAGGFTNRVLINGTQKLSITSGGDHTHSIPASTTDGASTTATSSYGTGGSHNNMPPYITCYMWQRTA